MYKNSHFPGLLKDKPKLTLSGLCVYSLVFSQPVCPSVGVSSDTQTGTTSTDWPREVLMSSHSPLE